MPAVLNDAFRSPFDKISGQGARSDQSTDLDTSDIRNPDLDFSGLSGGSLNNYQQNYTVQNPTAIPPSGITWGNPHPNQIYPSTLTLPSPSPTPTSHQPQPHDCDRLIGEIISCRVCRQKLQRLMAAWDDDHPKYVEERDSTSQKGGAELPFPLYDLSPNLITNIIIGVAIMFMLDRILKLRV